MTSQRAHSRLRLRKTPTRLASLLFTTATPSPQHHSAPQQHNNTHLPFDGGNWPDVASSTLPSNTITGDDTTSSENAATKVFATPKLLEMVLLQPVLSARQLFGAIRTCKAVGDTIRGSLKLQRKMLLRKDPAFMVDESRSSLNPLLRELDFALEGYIGQYDACSITYWQNTVVEESSRRSRRYMTLDVWFKQAGGHSRRHEVNLARANQAASWRRTFITQEDPDSITTSFGGGLVDGWGDAMKGDSLGELLDNAMQKYEREWIDKALLRACFVSEPEVNYDMVIKDNMKKDFVDYIERHPVAMHVASFPSPSSNRKIDDIWALSYPGCSDFRFVCMTDGYYPQTQIYTIDQVINQEGDITLDKMFADVGNKEGNCVYDSKKLTRALFARLAALQGISPAELNARKKAEMAVAHGEHARKIKFDRSRAAWKVGNQKRKESKLAAEKLEKQQELNADALRINQPPGPYYGFFGNAWLGGKRKKLNQILDSGTTTTTSSSVQALRSNIEGSIRSQQAEIDCMFRWYDILKNEFAERGLMSAKNTLDGLEANLGEVISGQLALGY